MKKLGFVTFFLMLVIIVLGILAYPYRRSETEKTDEFITATATSSATVLLTHLYKEGYVKNIIALRILQAYDFLYRGIQIGAYNLSQSMNAIDLYQALANPTMRWINVAAGMRKEEVAERLSKALGWDETNAQTFLQSHKTLQLESLEGYLFPGNYLLPQNTKPDEASAAMIRRFNERIATKKNSPGSKVINLNRALIIASLIQREAASTKDMRLISGIIWNRIFEGMTLDIDATLQYLRGNDKNGWWPKVTPKDKFIDSPYNTYQNKGLPPTPISSPSLTALEAAYNPEKTKCLFYFHDTKKNIHCSVTYAEHESKIQRFYGTGKRTVAVLQERTR